MDKNAIVKKLVKGAMKQPSFGYPDVDPLLVRTINRIPRMQQVQYATKDQLMFLVDIADRFGLYDAADVVKRLI